MGPLPATLLAAWMDVFGSCPGEAPLFEELLRGTDSSYRRGFALGLVDVAAGGGPWEERCLAALLLQHQVSLLSPESWEEIDLLAVRLGIKKSPGRAVRLQASLLREGFSTLDPKGFARELLGYAERGVRVFQRLRGRRTSRNAWRDLLELSCRPCKLVFARWLFTPEEVVERILEQVRVSRGLETGLPEDPFGEPAPAGFTLPDFEARILEGLRSAGRIYWAGKATPARLNGLVEYPLTTVVLTVKPPGSGLELELKRSGRPGDHPLGVVFERGGEPVPALHRLDGGSIARALRWDAQEASLWAGVYRAVHGAEAPLSRTLAVSAVHALPGKDGGGDVPILDYFTRKDRFGKGFAAMRKAMAEASAAFEEETGYQPPPLPGELGLTVRFLSHAAPAQAILANTSSFRLDRVALYLSAAGPRAYFTHGLGVPFTRGDGRRLADEVLEEILGLYVPPEEEYRGHARYVAEALALPANRARADAAHAAVVRQTGLLWGTLLAIGGASHGESFVARNVGLRSVWRGGAWRVEILFMDHDGLWTDPADFDPVRALAAAALDERYVRRSLRLLEAIYQPSPEAARRVEELFQESLLLAWRKTRAALVSHPDLTPLFSRRCVRRLRAWDSVVSGFLRERRGGWRAKARSLGDLPEIEAALEASSGFLKRTEALYRSTARLR